MVPNALNVKLHRIHTEVAHVIHEQKGKLVPLSAVREKFPSEHRLNEALWVLIEQRVVVEDREYKGHYQLTREGAAVVDEQWEKLQDDLKRGRKVPMVGTDDAADARAEKARLEAEAKAKAPADSKVVVKPPAKATEA